MLNGWVHPKTTMEMWAFMVLLVDIEGTIATVWDTLRLV